MQLSKHLSLAEVTRSETAKRKGVSNMPTPEHLENFKLLAEKVFEPIREHFKVPIHISSGYRSKELNKAIGGSLSSQHLLGQAIDIDMDGSSSGVTNKQVFDFIIKNLDFDQAINEFNYSWVHVSYNSKGKQRKQVLDAIKVGGKTTYVPHK
jgi:hypothetical protein